MTIDCSHCPLRRHPLFDPLTKDELAFMRRFKVGEMRIDPGTPILLQGSKAPQLYTALDGMGLRSKLLPNGQRQVVNFILPGDFIGLQAGLMGEMKHSAEATTAMTLCVFDRSELWTLFKTQPERAFDISWLAALEEHFLGEALTAVGQMSAEQRLCWGVSRVFRRMEQQGLVRPAANGDSCPFPYRQQDLADALGLSLVHTNKTLAQLRRRKILSWVDGRLAMHDRQAAFAIGMVDQDTPRKRPLL